MKLIFIFSLILAASCKQEIKHNGITDSITDDRGLTSVKFIQDGKEWGMDYLNKRELDSLKSVLNPPLTQWQKDRAHYDSVYLIPIRPYLAN